MRKTAATISLQPAEGSRQGDGSLGTNRAGASAGHHGHMETQLMSPFSPKKGPLSEGQTGTLAHGEGSRADAQKGCIIFIYIYIFMHTYIFMYIYVCIASTYRHVCCQARDERGCDGVGDGGVGTLRFFSCGSDDVEADEGIETRRSPFEHLHGGSSI